MTRAMPPRQKMLVETLRQQLERAAPQVPLAPAVIRPLAVRLE